MLSFILFSIFISLIFDFIFINSFLLFALGSLFFLCFFFFFNFGNLYYWLEIFLFSYNKSKCSEFSSKHCSRASHKFWLVIFSFLFSLKFFLLNILVPFGLLDWGLQFLSGCWLDASPISLPCGLLHRTAHNMATGSH